MENDKGLTIRIVVRLPDFDAGKELQNVPTKLGGRWYESEGRAQLVIILKRMTHQIMQNMKYNMDIAGTKFHVRLYQWIEGAGEAKLPKMRDIVDSDRDFFNG
jgi:hypothetical protein